MELRDGKLAMGIRQCINCGGTRKTNEWVTCPDCKGTGLKTRNRRCKRCGDNLHNSLIRGKVLSIGTGTCGACTDGTAPEDYTDSVPQEIWQGLTFKVYRSNRHQTFNENMLGMGCVYSCTDYGRHKTTSDEDLIQEVRNHTYIQACKFSKRDGTLCDHIGIFTNDQGFSVKAVYGDEAQAIEEDFKRQLSTQAGMAIGTRLANEGMNGTLAAALYRTKK